MHLLTYFSHNASPDTHPPHSSSRFMSLVFHLVCCIFPFPLNNWPNVDSVTLGDISRSCSRVWKLNFNFCVELWGLLSRAAILDQLSTITQGDIHHRKLRETEAESKRPLSGLGFNAARVHTRSYHMSFLSRWSLSSFNVKNETSEGKKYSKNVFNLNYSSITTGQKHLLKKVVLKLCQKLQNSYYMTDWSTCRSTFSVGPQELTASQSLRVCIWSICCALH